MAERAVDLVEDDELTAGPVLPVAGDAALADGGPVEHGGGPVGVMFHHAVMDDADMQRADELLRLRFTARRMMDLA